MDSFCNVIFSFYSCVKNIAKSKYECLVLKIDLNSFCCFSNFRWQLGENDEQKGNL